MADLDRLTIPPSEALLGALVLNAVREQHAATCQLDSGTSNLLSLVLGPPTPAAAIATLIVAIAKSRISGYLVMPVLRYVATVRRVRRVRRRGHQHGHDQHLSRPRRPAWPLTPVSVT
jgi:uncharacterized protein (DUF2062 family)